MRNRPGTPSASKVSAESIHVGRRKSSGEVQGSAGPDHLMNRVALYHVILPAGPGSHAMRTLNQSRAGTGGRPPSSPGRCS